MPQGKEFASAITIRLGILGAGVLGAFAGHWIEMMSTPAGEVVLSWPTIAGAGAGLVTGWVTLTWLARRHRGAGVIAGSCSDDRRCRGPARPLCLVTRR